MMHVTILTSCKHAGIIQCHLYPQHCNSHFNGTADILTARSSLLSTEGLLWDLNSPRDKASLCELRRDRAS